MGITYNHPRDNKLDKEAKFCCVPCVLSFDDPELWADHLKTHGVAQSTIDALSRIRDGNKQK